MLLGRFWFCSLLCHQFALWFVVAFLVMPVTWDQNPWVSLHPNHEPGFQIPELWTEIILYFFFSLSFVFGISSAYSQCVSGNKCFLLLWKCWEGVLTIWDCWRPHLTYTINFIFDHQVNLISSRFHIFFIFPMTSTSLSPTQPITSISPLSLSFFQAHGESLGSVLC